MQNPMDMSGQTILVTGASSGIGLETSILLSRLGARVVLVARNADKLARALSQLEGADHAARSFDLRQVEQIPDWIRDCVGEFGPLNGIVHSAGIQILRPIRFMRHDEMNEVMRVNLDAGFGLVKGLRQKGCRKPEASVVLLASVLGVVGQPGVSAYAASKGAVIAFTKSAAMELAPEHIRINCIVAGYVRTAMAESLKDALTAEQFAAIERNHPLGIGTPRDVAHAAAFLLAETGRWVTGTAMVVDGGFTAH
jgi:NAD(P)-dependent dehydrogenase (short-subunit alcohol dehydrogenase family)